MTFFRFELIRCSSNIIVNYHRSSHTRNPFVKNCNIAAGQQTGSDRHRLLAARRHQLHLHLDVGQIGSGIRPDNHPTQLYPAGSRETRSSGYRCPRNPPEHCDPRSPTEPASARHHPGTGGPGRHTESCLGHPGSLRGRHTSTNHSWCHSGSNYSGAT